MLSAELCGTFGDQVGQRTLSCRLTHSLFFFPLKLGTNPFLCQRTVGSWQIPLLNNWAYVSADSHPAFPVFLYVLFGNLAQGIWKCSSSSEHAASPFLTLPRGIKANIKRHGSFAWSLKLTKKGTNYKGTQWHFPQQVVIFFLSVYDVGFHLPPLSPPTLRQAVFKCCGTITGFCTAVSGPAA